MPSLSTHASWLQFELFKDFTKEEVNQILSRSQLKKLKPGEVLIQLGQPNQTLYLVVEGELKIVLGKNGTEMSLPIQQGECLGEMSLMMERPTSALVQSEQESEVLAISESVFWEFLMVKRKGARNLMSLMASRLQHTNHLLINEVEEQLKYKHLQRELETAGKLQADIVPNGSQLLPHHPQVDAYALIEQARDVGGDFYDALELDDEHIYLTIGDVSGKGMPAALFMVRAFTFLRLLISNNPGFENVIPALNQWLAKKNENMMFITIFAGVLNLKTGVLRYVNAGHNPPFLAQGGESFHIPDLPNAPLVGVMNHAQFEIHELTLAPGDAIILYTDGISEATNADQIMFETERIQAVLNQKTWSNMAELAQALKTAVTVFVGEAPQHDDYTIFALRYLEAMK
ncbi:MAG: SpoIIE family protein phosphatase [Bacteroidota bacterium]